MDWTETLKKLQSSTSNRERRWTYIDTRTKDENAEENEAIIDDGLK
jgi:hypothetical protein